MKKLLLLIAPFITLFCTNVLRYYSFELDFKLTPWIFVLISSFFYFIKFERKFFIFIFQVIGIFLTLLIIVFSEGQTSVIFLTNFIFYLLAVAITYIAFLQRKIWAKVTWIISLLGMQFIYLHSFAIYIDNYANAGSFTGQLEFTPKVKLCGLSRTNDTIEFAGNKIYLLDFWFTQCGPCFRGFPHLQEVYDKYKLYPNFALYAVNQPVDGDTLGQAFLMIEDRNYTFPVLIGLHNIDSILNISTYPTVCILQGNKLIFKGSMDLAEKELERIFNQKL